MCETAAKEQEDVAGSAYILLIRQLHLQILRESFIPVVALPVIPPGAGASIGGMNTIHEISEVLPCGANGVSCDISTGTTEYRRGGSTWR